jgi:S1-C subfamily serine protease
VNHGNSGGPLVDDRGLLVGINSLGNDQAQGQFYSISVKRVRQLPPGLVAGRSRANLGWNLIPLAEVDLGETFANDAEPAGQGGEQLGRRVADELARQGIDGLYVQRSERGSPAAAVRLGRRNLVTSIDGRPVTRVQEVCDLVLAKPPDETLEVSGYWFKATPDVAELLQPWTVEVALA